MAFRIATEASLAAEERNVFHPGAIVIDANENPLGPCDAARKAIVDMAPQGGRYSYWLKEESLRRSPRWRASAGVLARFPGSSERCISPCSLHLAGKELRHCRSRLRSRHESGKNLRSTHRQKAAHENVFTRHQAMLAAAPDAGPLLRLHPEQSDRDHDPALRHRATRCREAEGFRRARG